MSKPSDPAEFIPRSPIGLCATCRHMRQVGNQRGSAFYLCRLSDRDSRFPKYPRLPVLHCSGFDPASGEAEDK